MDGKTQIQIAAKSGLLIKPIPLHHYEEEFERLYQQSPMAKMLRESFGRAPTPQKFGFPNNPTIRSPVPKGFKLSKPLSRATPSNSYLPQTDLHHNVQEDGIELRVDSGLENMYSLRRDSEMEALGSESELVEGQNYASSGGLGEKKSNIRKSFESPRPRFQNPSGHFKSARKMPNLHVLIKRLASPREEKNVETIEGSGWRSCPKAPEISNPEMMSESESLESVPGDAGMEDLTPKSSLDNGSYLGNDQLTSKSEIEVDSRSTSNLEDTPVNGFTDGKKQSLKQRRLLNKLHSSSNQTQLLNTPVQTSQNRTTPAGTNPSSNKSPASDNDFENGFLTPELLQMPNFDPASGPSVNGQASSSLDTPVSRQASVMKTRSKVSEGLGIRSIIQNLQTAQKSSLPSSEIPYKGPPDRTRRGEENLPKDTQPILDDVQIQEHPNESNTIHKRHAGRRDIHVDSSMTPPETEYMDNGATYGELTESETISDRKTRKSTDEPPTMDKPVNGRTSPKKMRNISKEKPETIVNRWIIKPVPSCKGVCVEGHRVGDGGDQYWHSTAIMVRVGPRLLATKTGSLYRLAGKMDRALTMEQGFSESVVRSFQKGFPVNWREILYDHFLDNDQKGAPESSRQPASKKKQSKASPMPGPKKTAPGSVQKAKQNVEKTPQNLRVRDLQRSSSGRLIKPPLAYWTGQRIRHNTSLDFVEILQGTEDCTSSSANRISLQDSLEVAVNKEEKTFERSTKNSRVQKSSSVGGKKRAQPRKKVPDTNSESSPYPSFDTETDTVDSEDQQDKQTTSRTNKRGPTGKGKSTLKERKLGNSKQEELRSGRLSEVRDPSDVVSSSPDRGTSLASVMTESSLFKGVSNKNKQVNESAERIVIHAVGRDCMQPPPPQKVKTKERSVRKAPDPKSGAPLSPLYYHPSVDSEEDSTEKVPVGKTVVKTNSGLRRSTSDQRYHTESSDTDTTPQEEHESKQNIAKANPKQSDGTLNLQEEILAVVEKHKQGRMARIKERSFRIVESSGGNTEPRKSESMLDIYELSDDENEPRAKGIPYIPHGLTTTSDGSISDWSEEGNKSVNMTWVTRSGRKRRTYGTLEDPTYKTPESTETTTSTETEAIVNFLSLATATTGSSQDGSLSELQNNTRRSSARNRRGRSTKIYKSTRDETSTDEPPQPMKKPILAKNTKTRTKKTRNQDPESSSEATDDTLVLQEEIICQRQANTITSSKDTYTTVQTKKAAVSKGRSKKAVVVQRHQPSRNCKKSESDSDTGNIPEKAQNRTRAATTVRRDTRERHFPNQSRDLGAHKENQEDMGNAERNSEPKEIQRQISKSQDSNEQQGYAVQSEEPAQEVIINQDRRTTEEIQDAEDLNLVLSSSEPDLAINNNVTKEYSTDYTKENSTNQESQVQITLTAKVGTMKRKRQLRELVEQHNKGYEDDIFESTPFRKQKKRKIPLGEWDMEEDNQGVPGKTPGSARFKTPSTRYHGVQPLSDKKTPYSNLISPGLLPSVDRNNVDQYIHALQKKKGRYLGQGAYASKKASSAVGKSRPKAGSTMLTQAMNERIADVFDVTPAMSDSDPDEDDDYYWSDEEN